MKVTQTIIPGLVVIVCGLVLVFGRERILQNIRDSHNRLWKDMFGLSGAFGNSSEIVAKAIILVLGVGLSLAGVVLVYRYFAK